MRKLSLIFSLLLLACFFISSCDNKDIKDDSVFDFGGMKYGIAVSKAEATAYDNRVLIDNEINPFSEEYYYSDKVQRQAYVKKIEDKYNIKFDFTVKASDEDCYAVAWNSYPLLERNYSHNVVKNYAHPLYDLNTNEGIIKDSNYLNDDLKVELGTFKNNIYVYYPGNLYSYNFLYYNSSKDFGEYNPYELYKKGLWNLDNYKYVLENYCDNSTTIWDSLKAKFKDEYELESNNQHLLSATMPSDLAKGLASANGYNILNSNGYNGENTGVISIFNHSLDLFYNYYKYSNNDVLRFYEPLISIYNNSYKLSPFICDNTIVSGNLYSLSLLELGLMNKSTNDLKWQLIPYPSNNYENYTSFLDEYNQVGFTIVGKHYYNDTLVNSFNDKFTKEVAFEILYDLFDGYYQEYESVQEQNIKEFLGKYLTTESIDLFFELNKNKSLEAINILVNHSYNQVTQDFNVSSLKELNSLPLDSLLLMDEWYVEAYFNNEIVNYQNKFNYSINDLLDPNNELKSIHEIYEKWYGKLIK